MDCWIQENEKETSNRRNSNTQYLPIKCRTTRPVPPAPATNPLQFVKVAPPPLLQKAQEQVKKVEQVKSVKQDFKEDEEDWQQNLDNWKSSRRKRQEHIIERVVEVKKITQEEHEKSRRKSKTFNEILEERSKRGLRLKLPIFEDDNSDFVSYGKTSEQSEGEKVEKEEVENKKITSNCTVEKSDECEKKSEEYCVNKEESHAEKDNSNVKKNYFHRSFDNIMNKNEKNNVEDEAKSSQLSLNCDKKLKPWTSESFLDSQQRSQSNDENKGNKKNINESSLGVDNVQQYTYEGAIEGYRSRIKSKIKIDESVFNKRTEYKTSSKVDVPIPKGVLFKRKEIFEVEKPVAIGHLESLTCKRLSEDFANSQSIKDRLKSLEKCAEQRLSRSISKDYGTKWNNLMTSDENGNKMDKSIKSETTIERCFSPETEMYMNKLNVLSKDLDDLLEKTNGDATCATCSDREDSGIHTADVSCSVSQADESSTNETEDTYLLLSPADPSRLEKLTENSDEKQTEQIETKRAIEQKEIIIKTDHFLKDLQKDAAVALGSEKQWEEASANLRRPNSWVDVEEVEKKKEENLKLKNTSTSAPLILDYIDEMEFNNSPLAPPKAVEPPKEKPPPPPPSLSPSPPSSSYEDKESNLNIFSSTKKIKKEINVKRSSFLGLDEPSDYQIDPDMAIERPPDINRFLQEESQMEKSFYRKLHGSREMISEVESQDSGLESERGRLSSDTWCSNGTSAHFRQDSEQTNSVTSEEDEVMRKEREIIELVEKEEKSKITTGGKCRERNLPVGNNNYFPVDSNNSSVYCNSTVSDTDLEVMRVDQELTQLEQKEIESGNYLFPCELPSKSSRRKNQCRNNSLENICDTENWPCRPENYRKSLPDLYHDYKSSSNSCYRKSMSDINQTPYLSYKKRENVPMYALEYRKSMPELEGTFSTSSRQISGSSGSSSSLLKEAYSSSSWSPSNSKNDSQSYSVKVADVSGCGGKNKQKQPVWKHGGHALSAVPKQKHIPNDVWIQHKVNTEPKNYNQHWLLQEAELRRIEELKKNLSQQGHLKWQLPSRTGKHIPEPIIETLTHRFQNRTGSEVHQRQRMRRPQLTTGNKECNRFLYLAHDHNLNHGVSNSYPTLVHSSQESQNQLLSVSGKKKCSYCGSELGRGAAMIIESLALFYHMECFKCCVCHVQLGDGMMGTDVRVRNQKLHCHNCYSSDDGVKFSCV